MKAILPLFTILLMVSCTENESIDNNATAQAPPLDTTTILEPINQTTTVDNPVVNDSLVAYDYKAEEQIINTGNTTPEELVAFANTLIGTPYKYASTDPEQGFDCSGFINYVFNHFNIAVPRSSIDFTNVQTEVPLEEAKPGDLILFTGTDSSQRKVGHMGIVTSSDINEFSFIHSTSGKLYGVTITTLSPYYKGRFMKVIRVFPQNNG